MLSWRNHETNRLVSIRSHEIAPEEHRDWWSRVQDDPTREVLIFAADQRPLGVVSFFDIAPDGRSASWGFYLDAATVEAEGIGLTAWLRIMQDGIDHAFDVLGVGELHGEVLGHNEAVRMMNRRFRFIEGQPDVRVVDGRSIEVIPVRLARTDRRPSRPRRSNA